MRERYEIIKKVDSGGTGSVYKALDKMYDRKVVIRCFHMFRGEPKSSSIDQFFRIIGELSSISHSQVLPILDAGINERHQPYVVCPSHKGKTITDFLREHPRGLSVLHVHQLLFQLLEVLCELETQQIYLHALSANSILAQPKPSGGYHHILTDLGHSRLISIREGRPVKCVHPLDSALLAPELADDKPLGSITSLYLLGQFSYWLLAGCHPLSHLELPTAYAKHKVGECPPLIGYRTDIPDDFYQWHKRLILPEPTERYHSLRQALQLMPPAPKRVYGPRKAKPPVKMRQNL